MLPTKTDARSQQEYAGISSVHVVASVPKRRDARATVRCARSSLANEFETRPDEGAEYPQGSHRLSTNYPRWSREATSTSCCSLYIVVVRISMVDTLNVSCSSGLGDMTHGGCVKRLLDRFVALSGTQGQGTGTNSYCKR